MSKPRDQRARLTAKAASQGRVQTDVVDDEAGPDEATAEDEDEDVEDTDDEAIEAEVVEVEGATLDEDDAEAGELELDEDAEEASRPTLDPMSRSESRAATALARVPRAIERRDQDPLAIYMREVTRHPLLTREEEHQLAVLYHETGDLEAAKKLVTSNLRLVVKIAYEYKRAYKNMMDLVQEGNIGLMHAVKRYDPHRGVKLSSYSAWWIRAYILRFILNNWRLVKLGTTQAQRKLFFNLNKERARLSAMGIEPTHDEIAKRLEVDTKDVIEMDLRLSSGDSSLDAPIGDGEGRQVTRMDLLPEKGEGPDRLIERHELSDMLREHLQTFRETLSGKELQIFDGRMIAEDPMTLQQLGDSFGVTRERVRQLEARVVGRLRIFLAECLGDAVEIDSD